MSFKFGGPKIEAKKIGKVVINRLPSKSKSKSKAKSKKHHQAGTTEPPLKTSVKSKGYTLRRQAQASIRKRQKEASEFARRKEAGIASPYGHDKIFNRIATVDEDRAAQELKEARERAREERERQNTTTRAIIAKHKKNPRYKPLKRSESEEQTILVKERVGTRYKWGTKPTVKIQKEWVEKILEYEKKLTTLESRFVAKVNKMLMRKWRLDEETIWKLESIYARRTP